MASHRRAPLHLYHLSKRQGPPHRRFRRFMGEIATHTPLLRMTLLLIGLWLLFSTLIWLAERQVPGSSVESWGAALYWGVAAFSTAGIADTPTTGLARLFGGVWIVIGSMLFFGSIVATVTTYFMRPMQKPHRMIIDTIEYNLEQLDDLSVEEIELLKETVDALVGHVEHLKSRG